MQGEKTKVSVIVVNFNGMSHLEACLSSILNQSYQNLELILVDNGSTDGSLDYARRRFPHLLIVENKENLGYPGGINRGVTIATGEYIAPINFDTEVDQNWLASMVAFMDENPMVGAVTPKTLLYHDKTRIGTLGLNIHITGLGFARGLGQANSESPHKPLRVAGVSGCSFLIRREILEQMGGLNEDIFMYYDDVDLSWTVNVMGYDIYCLPESIVYHKYDLKMSPEKLFSLEYGRLSLLLRYMKPLTFVLCLPAFLFTELLVMGYCIARGRRYVSAKLRALISPFKDIRQLMEKRSEAQRLRRVSDFQLLRKLQLNYEWGQLFHILR
jgi:GT2 family glycosyltransferase